MRLATCGLVSGVGSLGGGGTEKKMDESFLSSGGGGVLGKVEYNYGGQNYHVDETNIMS